VLKSLTTQQCC